MTSDLVMAGSYNYGLVALSIVIAMLGSYATIDLAGRVTAARSGVRLSWQIGGATAMAIGTWAMHYTGMLAFRLPVPIGYDWPTSLLSLLPSLLASAVALVVVIRPKMESPRAFVASLFIGGGIAGLHYTAMASMRFQGMDHFSPALVTLSVVLAMLFALLSIWLTFLFRDGPRGWKLRKVGSVALMGAAIWVMHYTGMASASYIESATPPDLSHSVRISSLSAAGIGAVALTVLMVALLTSAFDRIQKRQVLLDELFEQAPQAVALMSADYRIIRVNKGFTQIFGYSPKEAIGRHLREMIVPDDLQDEVQKFNELTASGQRVETEAVRRRKDGSLLHVSILQVSVRLPGEGIVVYAIYRDITERKSVEEHLRQAEEQARKVLDTIPALIGGGPPDGTLDYCNQQWLAFAGLTLKQLGAYQEFLHPDDKERVFKTWQETVAIGKPYELEQRHRRFDGVYRWFLTRGVPLRDKEGRIERWYGTLTDIEDRKQAEKALQESEAKLKDAQRLAKFGYWERDLLADRITPSEETSRLFGLRPGHVLSEAELQAMIYPEDRQIRKQALEEALKGSRHYDIEHRIVRSDGEVRFVHVWDEIAYDHSGRPIRTFGTVQDITEAKRAEEALRSSETKFRRLLDSSIVGVVFWDLHGNLFSANDLFLNMIGYSRADLEQGRLSWKDITPPEYAAADEQAIADLLKTGNCTPFEKEYIRKDGSRVSVMIGSAMLDSQKDKGSSFIMDITERKRVEEQLQQSEERFRQMAESITEVFWMTTPDKSQILYVSPAYEKIWGRSRQSVYEDPTTWHDAVHPDDRQRVEKAVMNQQTLGGYDEEYRIIQPDGSVRWIRDRAFPINDAEGHVYRVTGIAENITERKLAEEKLRATTEQLRALSAHLQSAREEEATRIAREIHDQLGAALSSLRWDLEGIAEAISESADQSRLLELRKKIEAMMGLTDTTINSVRRIASELRPSALDTLGLIDAIEWQARQFQDRTGIIVQSECALEKVELSRDKSTTAFRIFQEALTNILRHAQATRVTIQMKEEDGEFILTISDNGRGITDEEKSGQRTLGLLGMRERAHLVGGKIEITGLAGKGTVVTVRIPISD